MKKRTRLGLAIASMALVLVAGAAALLAPYGMAEAARWVDRHAVVDPKTPRLAAGRMVDDYFSVQAIGPGVYAIGEPRYYQQNYAYLIVGANRALLFDAGTGTRDIRPIVAGLTHLPLTVMVSHLHFDHLGGAPAFGAIAMIDLPSTRADVAADGTFTPGRWQWLGQADGRAAPTVRVSQWIKPDASIDLGGRVVRVLSTPGHTPSSISLYDPAGHALFSGDFIYPTTLYAFLPGASLSAYQATARRLLTQLPADTVHWGAHCCRAGEAPSAPWLTMADLADLDRALTEVRAGRAPGTGFYPIRRPVNRQMTLATGFPWNNR